MGPHKGSWCLLIYMGAWLESSIIRYGDKSCSACPVVWWVHWCKQNTGLPSQLSPSHSLRIFKDGKLNHGRVVWFLGIPKGLQLDSWERLAVPMGSWRKWRASREFSKSNISWWIGPRSVWMAFLCSGKSPEHFWWVRKKNFFWPKIFLSPY